MTSSEPLVLLIEDDDDHACLIRRCLESIDAVHQLRHFADAQSALDYLFRRGKWSDPAGAPHPALILLDLRLPRLDGLEVLEQIKSSDDLATIPTIVLSTSNARRDISAAYALHANSYLVKPPNLEDLVQMMQALCAYWLSWNRR